MTRGRAFEWGVLLGAVIGVAAMLLVSCGDDDECEPGTDGCPCTAELECDAGLACRDHATTADERGLWLCSPR